MEKAQKTAWDRKAASHENAISGGVNAGSRLLEKSKGLEKGYLAPKAISNFEKAIGKLKAANKKLQDHMLWLESKPYKDF
eukprot:6822947-Alexandrium_andersonii.AAC.1